ncbi:hypothetical protein AB7M56_000196 [Bradyrhizobium elkanii]|jgi:hypothetical protein|nr:hypothetical protein [Bradyrhizobium elkanii]MCS3482300.1 hypothetical protein [Bradyrhizobium elkanii]MCS3525014.1 hypothetical protein [Bradyrhizobium elkanii]MCS4075774.1 hypothetical protein [Bradyrhizobium elkanii]MCS4084977.1 hypothetical protein [Bradyrhizobium elkanii]
MIAMRVFERNGHQCLEKVRQTGPKTFELVGHPLSLWDTVPNRMAGLT